jgi:hypothetical protein
LHRCFASSAVGTRQGGFAHCAPAVGGFARAAGYCRDCGADVGRSHHGGCDLERCPRCDTQANSCECLIPGQRRNLVSNRATTRAQLFDDITNAREADADQ